MFKSINSHLKIIWMIQKNPVYRLSCIPLPNPHQKMLQSQAPVSVNVILFGIKFLAKKKKSFFAYDQVKISSLWVSPNPIWLMSLKKKKRETLGTETDMHTGRKPCEDWSCAAASQGTIRSQEEVWNWSFPRTFRGSRAQLTLWSLTSSL